MKRLIFFTFLFSFSLSFNVAQAGSVVSYKVKSGDTLSSILFAVGITNSYKAADLIDKKSKKEVRRYLQPGKELYITSNGPYLKGIKIPINAVKTFAIKINAPASSADIESNQISIQELSEKTVSKYIYRNLVITKENNSFYRASKSDKTRIIDDEMIDQIAEVLGWQIDFNQSLRVGDEFSLVYEDIFTENNKKAFSGELIAARYSPAKNNERQPRPIFAILHKDGEKLNYYDLNGKNVQKAFLRYPLRFSRISSRFGKRLHPISKRWKAHKGVDFAAPKGTPVFSTGDGIIERSSYHKAYGNLVTVRHKNNVKTRYAHLSGYAKGVRKGRLVNKGQVIGYVGSTGFATGPHLHYEWLNGRTKVNPLAIRMPSAESIPKRLKEDFKCVAKYWSEILTTTFYIEPLVLTARPKSCQGRS